MKFKTIDVVDSISVEAFNRFYLMPQKPVIIKDLVQKTPAGKKWTLDYLRKICGDVLVDVFDNSVENRATAITTPNLKMPFKEYITNITSPKPSTLRMFLFNMFKAKPQLRKDFSCPDLIRGVLGRIGFMFFGAKGIKVRIHQDIDFSNVILTQFHGKKRILLVAPEYSDLLYKLPFNTYSLVDLDKPDYVRYPGLKYIQVYNCTLNAGDSLYMPSGYWHYITYLEGGFAVSYRKIALGFSRKMLGLLSLFVYMPIDKLLHFIGGEKWLRFKENLADRRARAAIENSKEKEQFFGKLQTR